MDESDTPVFIGWMCIPCNILLLKGRGAFLEHVNDHDDFPDMQPAFANSKSRYLGDDEDA
jgi:hypothetical protein